MPNSALTGAPYPSPGSADNVPADIAALVDHYDTRVLLSFADTAERDSALPTPVAPLLAWCESPGSLYLYSGTGWQTVYEPAPPWRDITLVSGFSMQTAQPSYLIDRGRQVSLAGNIKPTATNGKITNGTHFGTLPAEARPPRFLDMVIATQYATETNGRISIQTDGQLIYLGSDVAWLSLDGLDYWLHWRSA